MLVYHGAHGKTCRVNRVVGIHINKGAPMKDRYKWMGHVYDLLSSVYSGGRIDDCKDAMLDRLRPDDTALFAGVGHGRDAIKAAQRDARITVVDLSPTMLEKFSNHSAPYTFKHPIRRLHEDILKVPVDEQYDMVFANFFLNVFPRDQMDAVVKHLAALAKPGGYVVVGDFAYPCGNMLMRSIQDLYWYIAVSLFYLVTRNAFHPIYNYPAYLEKHGLVISDTRYFPLLGLKAYWSVLAQKPLPE